MKHNVFQLFRSYLQAGKEQLKNLKGNPFKKKWLKRLDRYIIVKFLGTYFFCHRPDYLHCRGVRHQ